MHVYACVYSMVKLTQTLTITRVVPLTMGTSGSVEMFLVVRLSGGGGKVATGILWVEAKFADKHLTMQRITPHNKELPGPKCQ